MFCPPDFLTFLILGVKRALPSNHTRSIRYSAKPQGAKMKGTRTTDASISIQSSRPLVYFPVSYSRKIVVLKIDGTKFRLIGRGKTSCFFVFHGCAMAVGFIDTTLIIERPGG